MRWVGLKFKNLQSWEDGYIPLNPYGLTVITAASETGKSVYIKCLRIALFFKHIHPDDRKAIIRNGHKEGYLEIELEDGSSVRLVFRPTTFIVELHKDGDVSSWREFFPNEIKDMLGLIVNTDLQLILNLMDQESPMLFDGTSNEYNDEILGFYANHDDLIHRFDVLSEWETNVSSSISNKKSTLKYIEDDMKRIPVIEDLDFIEESLTNCEHLNDELKIIEYLIPLLGNIASLEPGINCDCSFAKDDLNCLSLLSNVGCILENINSLDSNYVDVDLVNSKSILADLGYLHRVLNILISLYQLETPIPTTPLDTCRDYFTSLVYLDGVYTSLKNIYMLERVPASSFSDSAVDSLNQLEKLVEVLRVMDDINITLDGLYKSSEDLVNSKKYIEELRHRFKVCALCGSVLE